MLTKEDYCDYDTCVALKELGYDGYCAAYYHLFDDEDDARNSFEYAYGFDFQNSNNIYRVGAPLLYQAQKWLRKEKGVIVGLHNNFTTREFKYYISTWEEDICTGKKYTDYEDALSDGIKEAVRLILEGKLWQG